MDKSVTKAGLTHATALGRQESGTVEVLAHASGATTATMLELARRHEIPVVQDFALSSALRRLPPGSQIPDEVFNAVAIVLEFLLHHERVLETQIQQREQN